MINWLRNLFLLVEQLRTSQLKLTIRIHNLNDSKDFFINFIRGACSIQFDDYVVVTGGHNDLYKTRKVYFLFFPNIKRIICLEFMERVDGLRI